jgi:hypothetical protein
VRRLPRKERGKKQRAYAKNPGPACSQKDNPPRPWAGVPRRCPGHGLARTMRHLVHSVRLSCAASHAREAAAWLLALPRRARGTSRAGALRATCPAPRRITGHLSRNRSDDQRITGTTLVTAYGSVRLPIALSWITAPLIGGLSIHVLSAAHRAPAVGPPWARRPASVPRRPASARVRTPPPRVRTPPPRVRTPPSRVRPRRGPAAPRPPPHVPLADLTEKVSIRL